MADFAGYVAVDWSAASAPTRGADSIWIAAYRRRGRRLRRVALENSPTRQAATVRLEAILAALAEEGRVLCGFDFPFGYPAGTARRLGGRDWRAIWRRLARDIVDADDNANNRFDVAERLNVELSGEAFPFWGHVREERRRFLVRRGRRPHESGDLAERRLADAAARTAQPVWKLAGIGAAGSQALLGIPRVLALRRALGGRAAIWPFETGLADAPARRVILAEAYPSLVPIVPLAGRPKDAAQVVALARHFATLDAGGRLAACFAGPRDATAAARRAIVREEAWILGLG
jgi:precorrin-8X/cobalt-precorrin-8 methylmutase